MTCADMWCSLLIIERTLLMRYRCVISAMTEYDR